ncbi:hypothetical protein CPB97_002186 [Podila verticillata]|nr:hypothetical protein CPB97_002186 [Podila verticillata]
MSDNPGEGSSRGTGTGNIGSLHTPTATPAGRLTSLRGGRGGAGASLSARGGAPKLKFAPTVPTKRNKKDAAPSLLEEAQAGSDAGRGANRGRGRGGSRGRGRGRPDDVIATASGPFSLGPAHQARSRAIVTGGGASGAHSSYTGVQGAVMVEGDMNGEDRDYYGDAAVDMKFGSTATDASAPTGLENPNDEKVEIKEEKMKEQDMEAALKGKAKRDYDIKTFDGTEADENVGDDQDIKMKLEGPAQDLMPSWTEDQLFFFQFPGVMPAFKPRPVADTPLSSSINTPDQSTYSNTPEGSEDGLLSVKAEPMDQDRPILIPDVDPAVKSEPVDTKLGLGGVGGGAAAPEGQRARAKATGPAPVKKEEEVEDQLQQEGKIGRLLIYKSGKVKMKVGDIIMDVSAGSECSFLQDIVVVDSNNKQAFVMGSVQKRMVCVPNLTQLLEGLEAL